MSDDGAPAPHPHHESPPDDSTWQGVGRSFDSLPVWAKVIFIFGFPTFVALVYMGQDAGIIPSIHRTQTDAIVALSARIDGLQTSVRDNGKRIDELIVTLNLGIKTLCENAATNPVTGVVIQPHYNNCKNIR